VRAFLPLPPSAPFAVHEDGRVFLRYWTGPHFPAEPKEAQAWIRFLEDSDSSDHQAALASLKAAVEAQQKWSEDA